MDAAVAPDSLPRGLTAVDGRQTPQDLALRRRRRRFESCRGHKQKPRSKGVQAVNARRPEGHFQQTSNTCHAAGSDRAAGALTQASGLLPFRPAPAATLGPC